MPTIDPDQLPKILEDLPPGVKIELEKSPSGAITMTNNCQTKTQLLAAYAHLAGRGISIRQAAEKYGVPRKVVSSWVYRSQDIQFVDEDSWPKLIDEAEAALYAAIYHDRQKTGLTGVPYFDEAGCLVEEVKHPHRSRRQA